MWGNQMLCCLFLKSRLFHLPAIKIHGWITHILWQMLLKEWWGCSLRTVWLYTNQKQFSTHLNLVFYMWIDKSISRRVRQIHRQTVTSICNSDLKTDRSKGRLLSWILLVPTGPLVPEIWPTETKPVRTFTSSVPERKSGPNTKLYDGDLSKIKRCVTLRYRSLQVKSRMCPRSVLASPLQQVGLARRSCCETE